jgi:ribose transport system permease protein
MRKNIWFTNPILSVIKNNAGIIMALFSLSVFLGFQTDSFLRPSNLINVLRQICINAILAISMTLVLISGGVDLTLGSIVGISGVTVVMLIESGTPMWIAVILAHVLGMFIGLCNGIFTAYTGINAFIFTLSMQSVIRGIGYVITGGQSIASYNDVFNSIGSKYLFGIPVPVYILAVVIIVSSLLLYRTRFGRRMYAIGGNTNAAKFAGIRIESISVRVYMISGLFSALVPCNI